MRIPRAIAAIPLLALLSVPAQPTRADDEQSAAIRKAEEAVALFRKTDPSLESFFRNSVGWAVFPSVVKAAVGLGGGGGSGVLFAGGRAVGSASLAQVTIGLALGGQEYAEIIFFENDLALGSFKAGSFALAAQVSAVAAASGAALNAKYQQGVAVFTVALGGLMSEASVGGQKFGFEPFAEKKP